MKLINRIKNYFCRKQLLHQLSKSTVSPQGECFIKYLIDVYVNCITDETIEHFEENLDSLEARYEKEAINTFPHYYTSTPHTQYLMRKMCTASDFLILLLASLTQEGKEKWFNYINNEERRNYYIDCVNNI